MVYITILVILCRAYGGIFGETICWEIKKKKHIHYTCIYLEPESQPALNGWMVGDVQPCFQVKFWNHPIATTVKKLFQVLVSCFNLLKAIAQVNRSQKCVKSTPRPTRRRCWKHSFKSPPRTLCLLSHVSPKLFAEIKSHSHKLDHKNHSDKWSQLVPL